MGRWVGGLFTALVFGLGAPSLVAGDDLVVGGEVRLTTTERTVAGILAAVTEHAMVVRENGAPVEIPRAALRKLEVMDPGRKAHLAIWGGSGVAIGGLLGLGIGSLSGCYLCLSEEETREGHRRAARDEVKYALLGALAGGASGLIIGKAIERAPHWEEVDMPSPKVQVGIMPSRGRGVRMAVAFSF